MNEPFWGDRPDVGDEVYIDSGDGITDGEIIGVVEEITDTDITIDGQRYALADIAHAEGLS